MAEEGTASLEELITNLTEYRGQLKQVEELLLQDPENADLSEMYQSLTEVIQLTEELVRDAQAERATSRQAAAPSAPAAAPAAAAAGPSGARPGQIVTPAALNVSSILPASVAEQIRKAQFKAALAGQAPAAWAVGMRCEALYSDGNWYPGKVEGVSESGNLVVSYEGYEGTEEVPLSSVRPQPEAAEVYQGVAAPRRKRVEEQPLVTEMPKWLEIKEGDDEKTKTRKKKLQKSFKSKMRFQNMDLQTKQKQDSWQSFLKGKGTKKKTGFMTDLKKDSIFKVPDGLDAKVGVTGSGKGLTDYAKLGLKRQRHEFDVDGGEAE